jgi:Transcription factor IIIC subunit delta N-term
MPWTRAKVRANVFANKEWKTEWPSDRDSFSIGAEQSLSSVAALAWSHQGLGLHRRCVLAVLTSNLLLSLYEADGQRRTWSRVAIVNKALGKYFRAKTESSTDNSAQSLRKSRIRSFTWCPPLKNAQHDRPDVRWGEHMLTVATDDNDVVLIRVRRSSSSLGPTGSQYSMDVTAHFTLDNAGRNYGMVPTGSLWADALESKSRILHVACGPWSRIAEENGRVTFGTLIAVVRGSTLHFVHAQASLVSGEDSTVSIEGQLSYTDILRSESGLDAINFTGPLSWIPIVCVSFICFQL